MRTREEFEVIERSILKPYACLSGDSKGRLHKEDEHNYRTAFQRDRDRIVHATAFRRLEYKTQVFVNHEGDYYRTRLTHTLEVAQIGRTIARALGVNEALTEGICLAHDLGHTPFGHSGQDILAELMKDHGGFEHNKQSFRIVTLLERPYPNFDGLNLTYELLEGITKHKTDYEMPDGTLFKRTGYPSIEAQIANLADEVAYNNHDIDDGLKSGLLTIEALDAIPVWQKHLDLVIDKYKSMSERQVRKMVVKSIINYFVTDIIQNTTQNILDRNIKTIEDVRNNGDQLVAYSEPVLQEKNELKRFLYEKMYRHFRVQRMADKAQRVIQDLFKSYKQNSDIIPEKFREFYDSTVQQEKIICDYIAGMTDRFALDEHTKLFDPHSGV